MKKRVNVSAFGNCLIRSRQYCIQCLYIMSFLKVVAVILFVFHVSGIDLFSAVCTLHFTVPCHLFLTCVTCRKGGHNSVNLLFFGFPMCRMHFYVTWIKNLNLRVKEKTCIWNLQPAFEKQCAWLLKECNFVIRVQ